MYWLATKPCSFSGKAMFYALARREDTTEQRFEKTEAMLLAALTV
jgi:hypothetical protein